MKTPQYRKQEVERVKQIAQEQKKQEQARQLAEKVSQLDKIKR